MYATLHNPEKCKILTTTVLNDRTDILAAGSDIEKVDDFCYLGSYISHNDFVSAEGLVSNC